MAELLGAISAGIGIATFAAQVGKGIKTVQRAISYNRHHASVDLESLEADLKNLHKVIEDLQWFQNNALVTLAVTKCQQTYAEMEPDLDRLMQIFECDQPPKNPLKSLKKHLTFKAEQSIRKMRANVSQIVDSLIPISILINQLETIQAKPTTGPVSPVIADTSPDIEPTRTRSASSAGSPGLNNRVVAHRNRAHKRIVETCSHKQMSSACGRFWWLELTSTPGFWHNCSTRCSTRCEWNAKLRLALTWLNIPFAVTASFGFASRNGQYELRPALSIQHVVRNTSPGFKALYLCKISVISVEESKQRLRDLYRSDEHFKYHVNPAGKSYLRHLVHSPWPIQTFQFELLEFFVTELGMDFSAEDAGFLIDCSRWIGEGRHLNLLDTILEHGFAPSAVDPPAAQQWPKPCDPDWISELHTPDPFFLDYFASIVAYEPGFSGVTDLQECILTDTAHVTLDSELSNWEKAFAEVNFLGQSSLHLAVGNIRIVTKLVELGHNLDVTDKWGTTPLMYAAAYGFEDVTVRLLRMGAKPGLQETRYNRTFLDFARFRGHWSLIHTAISTLQDLCPHKIYQIFVRHVVVRAMTSRFFDSTGDVRRQHIPMLIQRCDDVNLSIGSKSSVTDNSLMHYAKTLEEAEALVSRGFNLFNKPNSAGRLAIHSQTFNKALIRFCVEHGTNIDHVDANGQTLLQILLSRLASFNLQDKTTIRQIQCCLDLGADPRHSDDCKCPCSPSGCSSSAFFASNFDSTWFTPQGPSTCIFWIFEWQSILQDFHGDKAVREFLLSFIRRIKFDELGMTHVCCHDGSGMPLESAAAWICRSYPRRMDNEDMSDILEEEDEFIDILDQTMRELALKPVNDLQRYLLEILKEKHDQHLQRNAEERAKALWQDSMEQEKSDQWHVDYKKDEFWQQISPSASSFLPTDYSVPQSLASYIVYLDLECSWMHDPVLQSCQKDEWFSRRMRMVKEITKVFELSIASVCEYIDCATVSARLDMDENAGRRVKEWFLNVLQADSA